MFLLAQKSFFENLKHNINKKYIMTLESRIKQQQKKLQGMKTKKKSNLLAYDEKSMKNRQRDHYFIEEEDPLEILSKIDSKSVFSSSKNGKIPKTSKKKSSTNSLPQNLINSHQNYQNFEENQETNDDLSSGNENFNSEASSSENSYFEHNSHYVSTNQSQDEKSLENSFEGENEKYDVLNENSLNLEQENENFPSASKIKRLKALKKIKKQKKQQMKEKNPLLYKKERNIVVWLIYFFWWSRLFDENWFLSTYNIIIQILRLVFCVPLFQKLKNSRIISRFSKAEKSYELRTPKPEKDENLTENSDVFAKNSFKKPKPQSIFDNPSNFYCFSRGISMKNIWFFITGLVLLVFLIVLGSYMRNIKKKTATSNEVIDVVWNVSLLFASVLFCIFMNIVISNTVFMPKHKPNKQRFFAAWEKGVMHRYVALLEEIFYYRFFESIFLFFLFL